MCEWKTSNNYGEKYEELRQNASFTATLVGMEKVHITQVPRKRVVLLVLLIQ
jgi:hypothetical protein